MVAFGPVLPMLLPLLYFAVIIILTFLIARLASLLIGRAMAGSTPQVAGGARQLGAILVWFIGVVFAVQELGVSTNILLLVAFLLGVAAIVALREQLENLSARYFTDIYSPYKVGDTIEIAGRSGKVIEINAMSTVLLADADKLVAIPNSRFMREVVVNISPQAWKEVTIPVSLSGSVDLPDFESELQRSLSKLRLRLDRRYPPLITLKARTVLSTDLTITVMLRRPEDRDSIVAEVNKRVSEVRNRLGGARRRAAAPTPAAAPAPAPAPAKAEPTSPKA